MWIQTLTIDVIDCTLSMVITRDAERGDAALELQFREVSDVRVNRDADPTEVCLGDFLGIVVKTIDRNRARYLLETGDATLEFEAAVKPALTAFDGTAIAESDIFVASK